MIETSKSIRCRRYKQGAEDARRDFDHRRRRKGTARRPWWSRGYLATIEQLESEDRRSRRAVAA